MNNQELDHETANNFNIDDADDQTEDIIAKIIKVHMNNDASKDNNNNEVIKQLNNDTIIEFANDTIIPKSSNSEKLKGDAITIDATITKKNLGRKKGQRKRRKQLKI